MVFKFETGFITNARFVMNEYFIACRNEVGWDGLSTVLTHERGFN